MAGQIIMIGHPVAGVKLPQLFNARFIESGLDTKVDVLDVQPEHLNEFLMAFRKDAGTLGIISTAPHKRALAAFADQLGASAARTGLANALRRSADGKIEGEMFDAHAFRRCLHDAGVSVEGLSVGIIGFGAAGRTCAMEAVSHGAARILAHDRSSDAKAEIVKCGFVPWDPGSADFGRIDLLVNAASSALTSDFVHKLCVAQSHRTVTIMDLVARDMVDDLIALSDRFNCRLVDGSTFAAAQFEAIWRFLITCEDLAI